MDASQLLVEAAPMLDDVLGRIGLHRSGQPLDLAPLVQPMDQWLKQQAVSEEDFGFLVMLVGGFIAEHLKQSAGGRTLVANGRPAVRLPVVADVAREFDPYAAAAGLVRGNKELAAFLSTVGS